MDMMTIFYKQDSGKIMSVCDGVQCFDYFNGQAVDLRLLTIEHDAEVSRRPRDYVVLNDVVTRKEQGGTA